MIESDVLFDPRPAFKMLDGIKKATPKIRKTLIRKALVAAKIPVRKATYSLLKRESGDLGKGLRHKVFSEDAGAIYQKTWYAGTHAFGKIIYPKKAKFLRFIVDGQYRTAPFVVIPQRDFFFPAASDFFKSERPVEVVQAALDAELEKLKR